jgi:hypothetical protein
MTADRRGDVPGLSIDRVADAAVPDPDVFWLENLDTDLSPAGGAGVPGSRPPGRGGRPPVTVSQRAGGPVQVHRHALAPGSTRMRGRQSMDFILVARIEQRLTGRTRLGNKTPN